MQKLKYFLNGMNILKKTYLRKYSFEYWILYANRALHFFKYTKLYHYTFDLQVKFNDSFFVFVILFMLIVVIEKKQIDD